MANIEKADYGKFLHDMENHNGCSFMDAMKGMSLGEQLKAVHEIARLSKERSDKSLVQIYDWSMSHGRGWEQYPASMSFGLAEKNGFLGIGDTGLFNEYWKDGNSSKGSNQLTKYQCNKFDESKDP